MHVNDSKKDKNLNKIVIKPLKFLLVLIKLSARLCYNWEWNLLLAVINVETIAL